MMWVYGSGMPHGKHNIGKAMDKADKIERPVVGSRVLTGNAALLDERQRRHLRSAGRLRSLEARRRHGTWERRVRAVGGAWNGTEARVGAGRPRMKPLEGTIVQNARVWGTGGINIDGARISLPDDPSLEPSELAEGEDEDAAARWPANVVLSHSADCAYVGTKRVKANAPAGRPCADADRAPGVYTRGDPTSFHGNGSRAHYGDADGLEEVEMWECAEDCPVRILDQQSGVLTSGSSNGFVGKMSTSPSAAPMRSMINAHATYTDSGGASRYFYIAKVDRAEREFGCEHLPIHIDPRTVHKLTHHCTSCSLTNARYDANTNGIVEACPGSEDGQNTHSSFPIRLPTGSETFTRR